MQEVNMQLQKFDELDALIKGILYAETHNRTECYYYENASDIRWDYLPLLIYDIVNLSIIFVAV